MAKKQNRSTASSNRKPQGRASSSRSQSSGRNGAVLDDLTYDVITVLHEKSKGLEAYEKYLEDASGNDDVREVFEELRDQDQQAVQRLEEALRTLIGGGELSEEEEEDVA
jgi:hypothetical protein